jgi:hypothetical protein
VLLSTDLGANAWSVDRLRWAAYGAGLAGFGEVNHHVVRACGQKVKVEKRVASDMDAHLVETDKAGAHCCYDGYEAFQPIEVCWAETGLVPADEFRDGLVVYRHLRMSRLVGILPLHSCSICLTACSMKLT